MGSGTGTGTTPWPAALAGVLAAAALVGVPAVAPAAAPGRSVIATKHLSLRSNGVATRHFRTTADSTRITLRAAATWCSGPPRVTVRFDAGPAEILRLSRGWRDYRLTTRLRRGAHVMRVRFADDRTIRGRCSRAVRIGALRLRPERARQITTSQSGAAPRRYVPMGAALNWAHVQADPVYAATAVKAFNSFTPENEMKMNFIQPGRGDFNFAPADALVNFALANGKQVHGHALVFGDQTPGWVKWIIDKNEMIGVLHSHIDTVMKHFAGRVGEWDVVNEALDAQGHFKRNPFYNIIGPTYVDLAFQFAREADPAAKLYYNDFDAEISQPKRDAVFNLVRHLHDAGVLDGVGLQGHETIKDPPTEPEVEATLRMYQQAGIDVQITEADVVAKATNKQEPLAERLQAQAATFGALAQACDEVPVCQRFTVWGVSDRYSWLGADSIPLLFDAGEQPKPAYDTVRAALGH